MGGQGGQPRQAKHRQVNLSALDAPKQAASLPTAHANDLRRIHRRAAMGVISAAADAGVAILSLAVALSSPLVVAQTVLPPGLYPEPLRALRRWYAAEFDDYLVADPPGFFRGMAWLEVVFLLPAATATFYGVLARRRWAATGSLVVGVCIVTSACAILGDILGSGKGTPKLLMSYVPFALLGVVAVLRGLCSCSSERTPAGGSSSALGGPSARKKRV